VAHDPKNPRSRSPDVTAATSDHIGSSSGSRDGRTDRRDTPTFNPGDTIASRYRIVSILGTGGMGEVYRADDLTLGTSVALKFLPLDLASDPVRLDRFRSEVRVTRQISHANVCRVYDFVEADGRVFLTMEYIDGEDLASLVRRIGRLPQDKAVEIARQICAGLQAAHDQGVIHRDLKPSNVMIDGRGRARIMDFGIAAIGEVRGESAVAGTPLYMAPEQLAGREATAKSDIYALGLVVHEILTGRRVHEAETLADLRALHKTASRPSTMSRFAVDIDPAIERAVMRCLEPDPSDRPPSAIAVSASLPGGDPLAAALAAGETPSPELVAAAGYRGGLNPAVAVALIIAMVASIVAIATMVDRTDMIAAVNPPMPRAVLEQKARDILKEFGSDEKPHAEASGWFEVGAVAAWIAETDATPARWTGLSEMWGGPVQFWYRAADTSLQGNDPIYETLEDDPPRVGSGQRIVRFDALGHLLRLEIAPEGSTRPVSPSAVEVDEAGLDRAFALAGLDRSAFHPTDQRAQSRVEADGAQAWIGPYPGKEGQEVRASAGFRDGKVCWFRVEHPYELAEKDKAKADEVPEAVSWVITGLVWMILAGGALIAWKNIRAHRSDVRAAVRVALAILVCWGIGSVVMRDRIPGVTRVFFGEMPLIAAGVVNAGYFLLFYIALEPTARRVWPSLLVSWIRLTSGRWKDPLVGRDVLIGLMTGAMVSVIARIGIIAPAWFDAPPSQPTWSSPSAIMGVNHVVGFSMWGLTLGMLSASTLTLILVLLRALLRSKIAATLVLIFIWVVVVGASQWFTGHWTFAVGVALVQLAQIVVLLRFGFLATSVFGLARFLLSLVPAGFDSHPWWASSAVIPAIILAGLTLYGYLTAVGEPGPGHGRRVGS